jgi:multidrug efflux pump subunit AcrA (membrane-fusion protein)
VRVEPRDASGKLKPGMLAQVSVITGTESNALLVPREAILGSPNPNGQATIVALDGGRAERKTVQLGLVSDRFVEVRGGLNEGQLVAIGNANGLNTGDVVSPQLRTALVPAGVQ